MRNFSLSFFLSLRFVEVASAGGIRGCGASDGTCLGFYLDTYTYTHTKVHVVTPRSFSLLLWEKPEDDDDEGEG